MPRGHGQLGNFNGTGHTVQKASSCKSDECWQPGRWIVGNGLIFPPRDAGLTDSLSFKDKWTIVLFGNHAVDPPLAAPVHCPSCNIFHRINPAVDKRDREKERKDFLLRQQKQEPDRGATLNN